MTTSDIVRGLEQMVVCNAASANLCNRCKALIDAVTRLRELELDAGRYRWLRDSVAVRIDHDFFRIAFQWRVQRGDEAGFPSPANTDAAISSAMKEKGGE